MFIVPAPDEHVGDHAGGVGHIDQELVTHGQAEPVPRGQLAKPASKVCVQGNRSSSKNVRVYFVSGHPIIPSER